MVQLKLFVAIAAVLLLSFNAKASSLRDTFDYYKSHPAGQYNTQDMQGWVGPAFQARNNLPSAKFVTFQPPSITSGCGGIDFFAGSFSLITKDELVQMARGIAAGAPGYFFNLAIDSVCPTCGANMKELSRKLEQFNKYGTDSCNQFWDWATDDGKAVKDRLTSEDNSIIRASDAIAGFIPDFGAGMSDKSDVRSTEGVDRVENNATAFAIDGKINVPTGVLTDIHPTDLFINYFGTLTVDDDAGTTKLNPTERTLSWEKLLRNPTVGDNVIKLNKCADLTADPKCLEMIQIDYVFKGLVPSYDEALTYVSTDSCTGIFHSYYTRRTRPICTDYEAFHNNHKFPYPNVVKTFQKPGELGSIAAYFAIRSAMNTAMKFHAEMAKTFKQNYGPGYELPAGISASDYEALFNAAENDFQTEMAKLKAELDAHVETLVVMGAFADLTKFTKGN